MLKLEKNPPIRPASFRSVTEMTGNWWLAYTKARAEKAFAWDLLNHNIPYFLPLLSRVTVSGGRRRHVMTPLFSSYVFFCGDHDARREALITNRLSHVLPVTSPAQLVSELASIERAIESGEPLNAYPSLAVGKRCRVARGSLTGVEGIVLDRGNIAKIVLNVSMLGQGVTVEIPADLLDVLD